MPASSSAGIFRFLEESTPGVIESGGPQIYRVTGGTLSQSVQFDEDNELRSDRGRGPSTLVSGSVAGPLNINWSHKTHDTFLEALLASTFTAVDTGGVKTVADMVFDATTHSITSASAALPVLEKGQWFGITGGGNAANRIRFKASSTTAPTASTIVVDTAVSDVTTQASASTVITSSRLKQGYAAQRTFTIERELSDVSQFFTWKGCHVSSLDLSYSLSSKLSGTFNFMAEDSEVQGTASLFGGIGSAVAATTTPYFNTISGAYVLIDGAVLTDSCIESLTVNIAANLRERRCIGSGIAPSSIGTDPFTITGQANIFFGSSSSATLYGKKLSNLPIVFAVCLTDSLGNAMAITFPAATVTAAEVDGGSIGSDVMMNVSFTGYTDSTFSTMLAVDRIGSVA